MHSISNNIKAILALTLFVLVGISILIPVANASNGCYNKFIFNWFSANDFFQCIDNIPTGATTLSQLSDVSLINLQNNQILKYNNTSAKWYNTNSVSVSNATCTNLGSGKILCASYSSNNINFKSLLSGLGITLINDTNTITISNSGVLHDIAGNGISVNQTSGNVLITNSLPENTVCNNSTSSAGHKGLCKDNTIDLRTLLAGTGISLSLNSTDILLTNTGIITESCSSPISCSGTNPSSISCATCVLNSDNTVKLIQLCQNSLANSATSLSCSNFTAKKHLWVDVELRAVTNTLVGGIQFNSDTSANYAWRVSTNGGADTTGTAANQCGFYGTSSIGSTDRGLLHYYIYNNQSGDRKGMIGMEDASLDTSSSSTPARYEFTCKWDNTSAQITTITLMRVSGSGSYNTGTEITVWGYD